MRSWKRAEWSLLAALAAPLVCEAQDLAARLREAEVRGEARQARQELESAVKGSPRNVALLALHAEYLDQRRDPGVRAAYERLLAAAGPGSAHGKAVLRRLAVLDLLAGDRASAVKRLGVLSDPELALAAATGAVKGLPTGIVEIPGPMRSFARMAALSPDLPSGDTLLALARNIVTNGYQAVSGSGSLEPTEYLKLVIRYLGQARELDRLAGESKVIQLENCDSTRTGELLKILGFRMRGGCGSDVILETVNATRAFLAMDSGFPLTELEQALRTNRPFTLDYRPTRVPVLYSSEYWLSSREKQSGEFIDAFLNDPSLCRLYLGLAKLDPETAEEMRKALPVARIRAFAHVFDFFGGMFRIREGKVGAPGGARSAGAWTELAGASPDDGVKFVEKLVTKDDGWLASYYDSLSRIQGPALDYLTEPSRLRRFYAALRGKVTSPGPARPVFRANTDLMLLTARVQIKEGRPHIPGGLEVWKRLFTENPHGKYDGKLTRSAAGWREPDDLLEALFGLSRKAVENEPLKIYLAISDVDRRRARPLEQATVERMVNRWRVFGAQYALFSETPQVSDRTIALYLDAAQAVSDLRDNGTKADAAGIMQSLAGMWQVLVRQKLVPAGQADATLAAVLEPFQKAKSPGEIFDCGRGGVVALQKAAGVAAGANPQDRMLDLLAGAVSPADEETHQALLTEMMRGFEAQKLVSLKVLFDLDDHLGSAARGEKANAALLTRLVARVSELNLPKASLSSQERNAFAFGYWTEKHIENQRKLNFRAVIEKASGQPEKLRDARGLLAPLLRDTLVGLLYIHYAPPGAQVLYTNPLFARSHDFIGIQGNNQTWKPTEVLGSGWPSSAGGRLVGSLVSLPYALAEAEQNFLIPTREQALIWGDLVPQMLVSSKLPRFWNVEPVQAHYVGLHMRVGETLLAESALSAGTLRRTLEVLDRVAPPARVRRVADYLAAGEVSSALEQVTPSEIYQLGVAGVSLELGAGIAAAGEIRRLEAAAPQACNQAAVSEAFGTPKPTLTNSQHPELLYLRTFPTLMGYSSRILAESWESNNLFFAELADELYLPPSQLNVLLPEWTQKTVEQIFATHLEDWPALLRSMRITAEGVRTQTRKLQALETKAGLED
ncbi:MAG: hypothetical protein HY858_07065 [Candidatus Solibacter usitatus]|nr:hypothetical protein [Candidatus Solibacter usitatus]